MKYYVYLKAVEGNYYYSVDLGNLMHLGDVITLGDEKFIIIGGQVLPKRKTA